MYALPAPVGTGEQRCAHLRQLGSARAMPRVVERMFFQLFKRINAVRGQFRIGLRHRTRHRFAGVGVFRCAVAPTVLDVHHLMLGPALLKLAQDAAMVARVTIAVVLTFPRNNGRKMRRMPGRHAPLVAGVIRDAEHAHLAVAPRLRARPFDALIQIINFAR